MEVALEHGTFDTDADVDDEGRDSEHDVDEFAHLDADHDTDERERDEPDNEDSLLGPGQSLEDEALALFEPHEDNEAVGRWTHKRTPDSP